jgi:hypothetical protein
VLDLKRRAGTTFVSNNAQGRCCVVKRLLAPKKDPVRRTANGSAPVRYWASLVTFANRPRRGWPAAQSFLAGRSLCIGSPGLSRRAGLVKGRRGGGQASATSRIVIPEAASPRCSSRSATVHLRISWESTT